MSKIEDELRWLQNRWNALQAKPEKVSVRELEILKRRQEALRSRLVATDPRLTAVNAINPQTLDPQAARNDVVRIVEGLLRAKPKPNTTKAQTQKAQRKTENKKQRLARLLAQVDDATRASITERINDLLRQKGRGEVRVEYLVADILALEPVNQTVQPTPVLQSGEQPQIPMLSDDRRSPIPTPSTATTDTIGTVDTTTTDTVGAGTTGTIDTTTTDMRDPATQHTRVSITAELDFVEIDGTALKAAAEFVALMAEIESLSPEALVTEGNTFDNKYKARVEAIASQVTAANKQELFDYINSNCARVEQLNWVALNANNPFDIVSLLINAAECRFDNRQKAAKKVETEAEKLKPSLHTLLNAVKQATTLASVREKVLRADSQATLTQARALLANTDKRLQTFAWNILVSGLDRETLPHTHTPCVDSLLDKAMDGPFALVLKPLNTELDEHKRGASVFLPRVEDAAIPTVAEWQAKRQELAEVLEQQTQLQRKLAELQGQVSTQQLAAQNVVTAINNQFTPTAIRLAVFASLLQQIEGALSQVAENISSLTALQTDNERLPQVKLEALHEEHGRSQFSLELALGKLKAVCELATQINTAVSVAELDIIEKNIAEQLTTVAQQQKTAEQAKAQLGIQAQPWLSVVDPGKKSGLESDINQQDNAWEKVIKQRQSFHAELTEFQKGFAVLKAQRETALSLAKKAGESANYRLKDLLRHLINEKDTTSSQEWIDKYQFLINSCFGLQQFEDNPGDFKVVQQAFTKGIFGFAAEPYSNLAELQQAVQAVINQATNGLIYSIPKLKSIHLDKMQPNKANELLLQLRARATKLDGLLQRRALVPDANWKQIEEAKEQVTEQIAAVEDFIAKQTPHSIVERYATLAGEAQAAGEQLPGTLVGSSDTPEAVKQLTGDVQRQLLAAEAESARIQQAKSELDAEKSTLTLSDTDTAAIDTSSVSIDQVIEAITHKIASLRAQAQTLSEREQAVQDAEFTRQAEEVGKPIIAWFKRSVAQLASQKTSDWGTNYPAALAAKLEPLKKLTPDVQTKALVFIAQGCGVTLTAATVEALSTALSGALTQQAQITFGQITEKFARDNVTRQQQVAAVIQPAQLDVDAIDRLSQQLELEKVARQTTEQQARATGLGLPLDNYGPLYIQPLDDLLAQLQVAKQRFKHDAAQVTRIQRLTAECTMACAQVQAAAEQLAGQGVALSVESDPEAVRHHLEAARLQLTACDQQLDNLREAKEAAKALLQPNALSVPDHIEKVRTADQTLEALQRQMQAAREVFVAQEQHATGIQEQYQLARVQLIATLDRYRELDRQYRQHARDAGQGLDRANFANRVAPIEQRLLASWYPAQLAQDVNTLEENLTEELTRSYVLTAQSSPIRAQVIAELAQLQTESGDFANWENAALLTAAERQELTGIVAAFGTYAAEEARQLEFINQQLQRLQRTNPYRALQRYEQARAVYQGVMDGIERATTLQALRGLSSLGLYAHKQQLTNLLEAYSIVCYWLVDWANSKYGHLPGWLRVETPSTILTKAPDTTSALIASANARINARIVERMNRIREQAVDVLRAYNTLLRQNDECAKNGQPQFEVATAGAITSLDRYVTAAPEGSEEARLLYAAIHGALTEDKFPGFAEVEAGIAAHLPPLTRLRTSLVNYAEIRRCQVVPRAQDFVVAYSQLITRDILTQAELAYLPTDQDIVGVVQQFTATCQALVASPIALVASSIALVAYQTKVLNLIRGAYTDFPACQPAELGNTLQHYAQQQRNNQRRALQHTIIQEAEGLAREFIAVDRDLLQPVASIQALATQFQAIPQRLQTLQDGFGTMAVPLPNVSNGQFRRQCFTEYLHMSQRDRRLQLQQAVLADDRELFAAISQVIVDDLARQLTAIGDGYEQQRGTIAAAHQATVGTISAAPTEVTDLDALEAMRAPLMAPLAPYAQLLAQRQAAATLNKTLFDELNTYTDNFHDYVPGFTARLADLIDVADKLEAQIIDQQNQLDQRLAAATAKLYDDLIAEINKANSLVELHYRRQQLEAYFERWTHSWPDDQHVTMAAVLREHINQQATDKAYQNWTPLANGTKNESLQQLYDYYQQCYAAKMQQFTGAGKWYNFIAPTTSVEDKICFTGVAIDKVEDYMRTPLHDGADIEARCGHKVKLCLEKPNASGKANGQASFQFNEAETDKAERMKLYIEAIETILSGRPQTLELSGDPYLVEAGRQFAVLMREYFAHTMQYSFTISCQYDYAPDQAVYKEVNAFINQHLDEMAAALQQPQTAPAATTLAQVVANNMAKADSKRPQQSLRFVNQPTEKVGSAASPVSFFAPCAKEAEKISKYKQRFDKLAEDEPLVPLPPRGVMTR